MYIRSPQGDRGVGKRTKKYFFFDYIGWGSVEIIWFNSQTSSTFKSIHIFHVPLFCFVSLFYSLKHYWKKIQHIRCVLPDRHAILDSQHLPLYIYCPSDQTKYEQTWQFESKNVQTHTHTRRIFFVLFCFWIESECIRDNIGAGKYKEELKIIIVSKSEMDIQIE